MSTYTQVKMFPEPESGLSYTANHIGLSVWQVMKTSADSPHVYARTVHARSEVEAIMRAIDAGGWQRVLLSRQQT